MKREELNQRFKRLYPGCTVYAIQLDGFTHKVFWKDEKGQRHIDEISAYASEIFEENKVCYNNRGQVAIKSFNADRTKVLFLGYPHYAYQGNACEYVYEDLKKWNEDTYLPQTGKGNAIIQEAR